MSEEFVDVAPPTSFDPLLVLSFLFTIERERRVRFLDALAKFSTIPNSTFDFKERETRCLFISNRVSIVIIVFGTKEKIGKTRFGRLPTRLLGLNSDELFDEKIKIYTYLMSLRPWIEIICSNPKEAKIFSRWVRAEDKSTYEKEKTKGGRSNRERCKPNGVGSVSTSTGEIDLRQRRISSLRLRDAIKSLYREVKRPIFRIGSRGKRLAVSGIAARQTLPRDLRPQLHSKGKEKEKFRSSKSDESFFSS